MNPENEKNAEAVEEAAEGINEMTESAEAEETEQEAAEETPAAEEAPAEEEALSGEEAPLEGSVANEEKQVRKTISTSALVMLIIAAAVVVLGVLAGILVWKLSGPQKTETLFGTTGYVADEELFGTNGVSSQDNYTVAELDDKTLDTVIARDSEGNYILTNRELPILYWIELYQFLDSYGSYASAFGLDLSQPLAGQQAPVEGMTWEQYFLDAATKNFEQIYALYQDACKEAYEMPEDIAALIDDLSDPEGEFAAEALENGYDGIDAYLADSFGEGVTASSYQNYLRIYYTAMSYYQDVLWANAEAAATDAAVEAYFDENAETYAQQGLEKVDNIDVRHILIQPEGEEEDWTDESWSAAEEEANRIYAQWLQDATAENFAALAQEYTMDSNADVGGLYEAVAPGDMVTEFNDWCFDETRKAGDHGIVKTRFGYHIMYFVGTNDGTPTWFETAKEDMINAQAMALLTERTQGYTVDYDFSAMKLFDLVTAANEKAEAE